MGQGPAKIPSAAPETDPEGHSTHLALSEGQGPDHPRWGGGGPGRACLLHLHGLVEEGAPLYVLAGRWDVAPSNLTKLVGVGVQGGLAWGSRHRGAAGGVSQMCVPPLQLEKHLGGWGRWGSSQRP